MLQGRRQIELLQGIYQALHMTVAAELRFVLVPLGVSDKRVEERRGELQQRLAYNSCSVNCRALPSHHVCGWASPAEDGGRRHHSSPEAAGGHLP